MSDNVRHGRRSSRPSSPRDVTGDAAHDEMHVRRVVANARPLAPAEGADLAVVIPAAWLHDCVIVPKDSPERTTASRLAAAAAGRILARVRDIREQRIPAIQHAIEAHSFTAQIPPRTVEARVVQDADRLDALGAVGIARTMMLGGAMGKPLYDAGEPFPITRTADDGENVLDHFFVKLLTLSDTMQTDAGREEAARRTEFMRAYLPSCRDRRSAERRLHRSALAGESLALLSMPQCAHAHRAGLPLDIGALEAGEQRRRLGVQRADMGRLTFHLPSAWKMTNWLSPRTATVTAFGSAEPRSRERARPGGRRSTFGTPLRCSSHGCRKSGARCDARCACALRRSRIPRRDCRASRHRK